MAEKLNGINAIESVELDSKYDLNNDGKIDFKDYDIGALMLQGNSDEASTLEFSQADLNTLYKKINTPQKETTQITATDTEETNQTQEKQSKIDTLQQQLASLQKEVQEKVYSSDISVSTLSAKGTTELQSVLEKATEKLEKYQKKLEDLKQKHEQYQEEQKVAEEEYLTNEENYNLTAQNLENENTDLENLSQTYDNAQTITEQYNEQIKTQKTQQETTYRNNVDQTRADAQNEYDKNSDGDYQTFVNNKINSVSKDSKGLTSLNSSAASASDNAQTLKEKVSAKSASVQSISTDLEVAQSDYESSADNLTTANNVLTDNELEIKSTQIDIRAAEQEISNAETVLKDRVQGSCMTGTELLAQISDEEKQLIKDNNIDITTCLIAQGADNKWHIYDANGQSIARQYGQNGGYDIVADGSGSMSDFKKAGETEEGKAVYKLSNVNADLTEADATWTSYTFNTTDDPLAFDVDGNGFKTTSSKIAYDIDADGKEDVINNTAEWILAFDKNGDGKVGTDGSELFGNNTDFNNDGKTDGYKDGFEALKALAKQENLIGDNDNTLDENDLKVLSDKYGLAMTQGYGGTTKSLSELGITQINLAKTDKTTLNKNFDGRNNDLMTQEGATFVVNGNERNYADVWNAKSVSNVSTASSNSSNSDIDFTSNSLLQPDVQLNPFAQQDAQENLAKSYTNTEAAFGEFNAESIINSIKNQIKNLSMMKK